MRKGLFARIKKTTFEGGNYVGALSHVYRSSFGYGSYCGSNCRILYTSIGKFCSIASHVRIIYGRHPLDTWVSTHPSFYNNKNVTGVKLGTKVSFPEYVYANGQYMVTIGNDVWLADGVVIQAGVSIGDGAIVLPGAVVTKNIEPYSIYGGVPAQKIKYRFKQEQIDFLLKLQWWDKDLDWIKNHINDFSNIEKLMNCKDEQE